MDLADKRSSVASTMTEGEPPEEVGQHDQLEFAFGEINGGHFDRWLRRFIAAEAI